MSKLSLLLAAAFAAITTLPAFASEAASPPAEPLRFGAAVTVKKPVNIAKLSKRPEKFAGKTLRLEGVVKNVCQGRGCWVEVADAKGVSFIARSLDESILLPKDCQGRKVVVQGLLTTMPSEQAEEPVEKGHACPRPSYVLSTQGVELAAAQ